METGVSADGEAQLQPPMLTIFVSTCPKNKDRRRSLRNRSGWGSMKRCATDDAMHVQCDGVPSPCKPSSPYAHLVHPTFTRTSSEVCLLVCVCSWFQYLRSPSSSVSAELKATTEVCNRGGGGGCNNAEQGHGPWPMPESA